MLSTAKSRPSLAFVNKVLSTHRHVLSHLVYGGFHAVAVTEMEWFWKLQVFAIFTEVSCPPALGPQASLENVKVGRLEGERTHFFLALTLRSHSTGPMPP